ncbi:Receptor-like protein 4 [Ranunculus cassubicifolius]
MLKLIFFLLQLTFLLSPSSSPRPEPFAIRISCGARTNIQTPPTSTLWFKDYAYTGGRTSNATTTSYISPPLKTLRYFPTSDGPNNCYNVNRIPKGHYQVRIFFGLSKDPNFDNTEPQFDVSMEGTQVYSLEQGWSQVDDQAFVEALLFVDDGTLSICFHTTGHGDPAVLSIEILQIDDNGYRYESDWSRRFILRTAIRLSCGTGKPGFGEDYNADHWGGDRFWGDIRTFGQSSDKAISTENKIHTVSVSPNFYPERLYQTALVSTDSEPDLSYTIEVNPNRNYSVWLHFAEIDSTIREAGQRVFDILINGDIAFTEVDVIKMSGDRYTALVLNRTVPVNGRSLNIALHPTTGGHAIINAIEVFEVIPAESRTAIQEVRALQSLKNSLGLPLRLGWNGDPCVPQQHPWSGVDCQFDKKAGTWVIDGLGLDNQGLRGFLPNDISKLRHLQSINLSGNSIQGAIPVTLGNITSLETLDLSFNEFNGSIPESLGQLTSLQRLNLNSNFLSGKVPATLGGRLVHRASFNFTTNSGLCGIPGLRTCGPHLSTGAKIGIALGVFIAFLLIMTVSICWWKRRENILRTQRIAARDAPYAKARTHFVRERDVQMGTRTATEHGPTLLS